MCFCPSCNWMMKVVEGHQLLLFLCSSLLLLAGCRVEALRYNHSVTLECLKQPLEPQYGGGILVNPEFNQGLNGWSVFGSGNITIRKSKEGNSFMVSQSRNHPYDSFSQKSYLDKEKLYAFSAWIQVSNGKVPVKAAFKTASEFIYAGNTIAKSGCWSMLKGGLTVNSSGFGELYFESDNTTVEIWVDNVSLQPFTKDEWGSHQLESIEKARKRSVRVHINDVNGKVLPGAKILVKQIKAGFPFGSAISKAILNNTAYQNWFASRFTVTSFENEMKWYSNELHPGKEDYTISDAMVQFLKQHSISIRGHSIVWDSPLMQQYWIDKLQPTQLKAAIVERINSVVSRYKGQIIGWDVVNENLHYSYYEDKLGQNVSSFIYQTTHQLDPNTIMFMNEFNTIEHGGDSKATPAQYLQKLRDIRSLPGNNDIPMGIGLQSHFKVINIPYMRASLDTLAATGLPIWLTELDVEKSPNQTQYLEELLREGYSHPAVKGIVMWAIWHPNRCIRLCLTDDNFKNLPAGDLVDKLIEEWKQKSLVGTTDSNGDFEARLSHGDYDVIATHPSLNSIISKSFKVIAAESSDKETLQVRVTA